MKKTDIVILAGGLGKRMQTEIPKVLNELRGKPMIRHVIESVEKSGVCEVPVIVVGKKREMVMEELGNGYQFAIQEEQLGTGHAVLCAEEILKNNNVPVMVLYGDMPYISAPTIANIAKTHVEERAILTMATVTVPDFEQWRAGFFDFSRIVRDANGKVVRTVEKKDAMEAELNIHEVNPCYFCFDSTWLWSQLRTIGNSNAQHEYYLTDLVKIAMESGVKIATVSIDPKEALGVNTKEHLALLHTI